MDEKIRPVVKGTAETMLQSFYARAQYSKQKNHKIYDAKAMEIVEKLDYDFSRAGKDGAMSGGVIARTIVLDELVSQFIVENPDCAVVNIACGLDTRFYRMDNGKIVWHNLDLPEVMALRNQLFEPAERVSNIGISVLDPAWTSCIEVRSKMLFVIEGLSMYLTADEIARMLEIIRSHFNDAYVIMECLAKKWVGKERVEQSIQQTGAQFRFGADCFEDLGSVAKGFEKVKDDDVLRGMVQLYPWTKPFVGLPFLKKAVQKILIFKKAGSENGTSHDDL
jgi:O-methyltransferase involved in polyketide biosynthesis